MSSQNSNKQRAECLAVWAIQMKEESKQKAIIREQRWGKIETQKEKIEREIQKEVEKN